MFFHLHDEICRIMIGRTLEPHAAEEGDEAKGRTTVDRL